MKYKIKYKGIDGSDTDAFKTLEEAREYVKERYLGSDYIRAEGLQLEFGYLSFIGFDWPEIGKFRYEDWGREFDFSDGKDWAVKAVGEGGEAILGKFATEAEAIAYGVSAEGREASGDDGHELHHGGKCIGLFLDGEYTTTEDFWAEINKANEAKDSSGDVVDPPF